MRFFVGAVAVALVAGCATYTASPKVTSPVPSDRLLSFQVRHADSAIMIVTRDDGYMAGGGCYTAVLIDGVLAGRLGAGERASFFLSPGRHVYGISGDPLGRGLCALQIGQPQKESSSDFKAGETQKYRISGSSSESWLDIRPTTM